MGKVYDLPDFYVPESESSTYCYIVKWEPFHFVLATSIRLLSILFAFRES